MAEYLAPGVYVEETSYRARSIEGVSTSTAGFVGHCRYGPTSGAPVLITSFDEFERYFGALEELDFGGTPETNHLAHAVQLFFANGGRRVYVARVFNPDAPDTEDDARAVSASEFPARFRARFPGEAGNLRVIVSAFRSGNVLTGGVPSGLRPGDVLEIVPGGAGGAALPREVADEAITAANLRFAVVNAAGELELRDATGAVAAPAADDLGQKITLTVLVQTPPDPSSSQAGREDAYQGLSPHPDSDVYIGRVLRRGDPENGEELPTDRAARIYLEVTDAADEDDPAYAGDLLLELLTISETLTGGSDGLRCPPDRYAGSGEGHSATGLQALAEVEDIAIVAAPDGMPLVGAADGSPGSADDRQALRNHLITHCTNLRYRFAILSAEADLDLAGIRDVRGRHDSKYAALYYPWLVVRNPSIATGPGRDTLLIPPDGAIAGVYARSDVERGVHKAPANEVVRNVLRFSRNVNKGMQDVLNPDGINCLRFFEGRGYRVWGARTISSDPEWKYLNVRRLFIFLEHSIDRGTQWAVFEPNNEQLWLKIRLTIESFLYGVWRTGALLGAKPEEAFFVRCDRTTMSQDDLDNGRLVCLIGVAPTKPAEFVIFRIGQWTADASII